ncbi:heme ABC exporter ATP-binding protein CcmA [Methyloferula stellata]|uniref:heme ABC exporter ATP-binding protein CcmA n=1 Tax=Methyloferula stellata TaxID=876270 RepID=UPI00037AB518|nr:heme ABC exporter ATP-binding protein CcmA [Methyloferula stellata]
MRLAATDLTLERGARLIFSHLSFSLESGEALAVTGANGAGKSSLLRALAGLLSPVSGTIELSPRSDMPRAEASHYLGHADALKGVLTLRENLVFWSAMLATVPGTMAVEAVLARFGLKAVADLPAAYLSAGQRRRGALARLLLAPRPIWLLDEPLTALDLASQNLLREVMQDHLAGGGLIIAATHATLGLAARELNMDGKMDGEP